MSLLQFKEFKVENFSTISMDSVRSKCSQCSQCSEYFPAKQIRIDTQRFNHYTDPNSFGGTSLVSTTLDCGCLRQFLLAFSWRRNVETLFSASPKDCISEPIEISGLRVFALLWILMVHVCTVLYFVSGEILWIINNVVFPLYFVPMSELVFFFRQIIKCTERDVDSMSYRSLSHMEFLPSIFIFFFGEFAYGLI